MKYSIEEMKPSDWEQVRDIYLQGINTGIATFQNKVPTWDEWDNSHTQSCRLLAKEENNILGWVALSPTSSRECYSGVAEVSIYINEKYRGYGVGISLLESLIKVSEKNGFWTLQSGILRENTKSIALHKKAGFREIGIRERIAKTKDGVWHDTVLMERRSKILGIS